MYGHKLLVRVQYIQRRRNDVRENCYVTTCYKQINSRAPGDCALMKILTCREPLVNAVET